MNPKKAIDRAYTLGRVAYLVAEPYKKLDKSDAAYTVIEETLITYTWELGHLKIVNPDQAQELESAYQRGIADEILKAKESAA